MARLIVNKYLIGSDGNGTQRTPTAVSANGTIISPTVCLDNINGASVQVIFPTATALAGTVTVQVSNYSDGATATSIVPSGGIPNYAWSTLTTYPAVTLSATSTPQSLMIDLTTVNARFLQVVWTQSGGSGTILAILSAKQFG